MYQENKSKAAFLGKKGEQMVAEYLKGKGAVIVKRNFSDRYGEVDIIAEDDKNIIFLEVKTRNESAIVSGLEAVDAGKMKRTKNAAENFIRRLNTDLPPRIDVAEVTEYKRNDNTVGYKLNYIKNAY
ncbi:MAG: YraN family protein [Clostridia bacterium]|nr:YraN family protein [Clostridia bacterium]